MKPEDDEHHGDDCPKCGAENALLFMGGDTTPLGDALNKSYLCDECGEWVKGEDIE